MLQFAYFNTESNFDYVTVRSCTYNVEGRSRWILKMYMLKKVYDGPTTASPVLLRLSGGPYSAYPDVVSSGSSCLVVHISDYSTSYNGWQANYYSTPITTTTTTAPVQSIVKCFILFLFLMKQMIHYFQFFHLMKIARHISKVTQLFLAGTWMANVTVFLTAIKYIHFASHQNSF